MSELRLGDVIDDYCIKCRRVTNHSIVSIMNGEAAKVRCRTCYHDHDYRHEEVPPSKKDLKKAELLAASLANAPQAAAENAPAADAADAAGPPPAVESAAAVAGDEETAAAAPAKAQKKARKTARK